MKRFSEDEPGSTSQVKNHPRNFNFELLTVWNKSWKVLLLIQNSGEYELLGGRKIPSFTRFWHIPVLVFSPDFKKPNQRRISQRKVVPSPKSLRFGRMPCHLKWRHSSKRRCADSIPMTDLWDWYIYPHESGQIIATSHDLTPNGGLVREIPLFQGNLGWWNIIILPATWMVDFYG